MTSYMVALAGLGVLILLVAWLPMVLKELPLSLPMFCMGFGAAAFSLLPVDAPDPLEFPEIAERLTELVVIVALTGSGLKLDRPIGWRSWNLAWRLLGIAMPLSILLITAVGWTMLGLSLAAALLLGAALSPTDPVLAGDVEVGPPGEGEEDEVRFTLTAEAGMNDALAFPFVHLALLFAAVGAWPGAVDWAEWLAVYVVWKLFAAVVLGWGLGKALGWLLFRIPNRAGLAQTRDGFVALGITFIAYSVTELCQGYGFLAVFLAAVSLRDTERDHEYHERLHAFTDQIERLMMMVLLLLLGGAFAGGLLAPLGWRAWGAVALILFVARPVAGLVSLAGHPTPLRERAAIAFFGIRGLGSLYYLAYVTTHSEWDEEPFLWAVIGLTVLCSVVIHGTTVTPTMHHLDNRRKRQRVPAG